MKKAAQSASYIVMGVSEQEARFRRCVQSFYPENTAFILCLPKEGLPLKRLASDERYFRVYNFDGKVVATYFGKYSKAFSSIKTGRNLSLRWVH